MRKEAKLKWNAHQRDNSLVQPLPQKKVGIVEGDGYIFLDPKGHLLRKKETNSQLLEGGDHLHLQDGSNALPLDKG